jgi:hypothetical protein
LWPGGCFILYWLYFCDQKNDQGELMSTVHLCPNCGANNSQLVALSIVFPNREAPRLSLLTFLKDVHAFFQKFDTITV